MGVTKARVAEKRIDQTAKRNPIVGIFIGNGDNFIKLLQRHGYTPFTMFYFNYDFLTDKLLSSGYTDYDWLIIYVDGKSDTKIDIEQLDKCRHMYKNSMIVIQGTTVINNHLNSITGKLDKPIVLHDPEPQMVIFYLQQANPISDMQLEYALTYIAEIPQVTLEKQIRSASFAALPGIYLLYQYLVRENKWKSFEIRNTVVELILYLDPVVFGVSHRLLLGKYITALAELLYPLERLRIITMCPEKTYISPGTYSVQIGGDHRLTMESFDELLGFMKWVLDIGVVKKGKFTGKSNNDVLNPRHLRMVQDIVEILDGEGDFSGKALEINRIIQSM